MTSLDVHNIDHIDWPATSSDLNIIKNVCGRFVREFYKNGRQFNNVVDLQDDIVDAWYKIDLEYIQVLYRSIKPR